MKKITFTTGLILLALMGSVTGFAQSKQFDDVGKVNLKQAKVIRNNKTIVGYAYFFQVEKMKKAAMYRLEILDENLKSIGSNEFEGSKELELLAVLYESDHLLLAFKDPKKFEDVEQFVKVFDLKGKQTGMVAYEAEKGKKGMMGAAIADQMESFYNGYENVDGEGFVCVRQNTLKTGGAAIQMISTTGKLKWEQILTEEKGDRMDLYLVNTTPNALIFFMSSRENVMAKDTKNFLIALNPQNGKELYRKSMEISGMAYEPTFFKNTSDGKLKMISITSDESDKFYSARPIGFNIVDLDDKTGNMKLVKNFSYENDLSSVLTMKSETKSEEGYLQIHDLTLLNDGSAVVVGEFFRRTVSALGVMGAALSKGRTPVTQMTIGDLFLLRLDKNYKAVNLEKIEKRPERFPLPGDGISLGLMQRYMKMKGVFGYEYTDESPDNDMHTVVATGQFEGENYGTSAISFNEKKGLKIKKFNLDKEGKTRVYLSRAKPGHVILSRYNSKAKTLTVSLERID